MNPRIKELAEQATVDIKDEYGHWIGSELDEEKFAELIVRECAWVADMGYAAPGTQIKEHFGVVE